MLTALLRIVLGYAIASAAAATVLLLTLPLIAGGAVLSLRDYLAAIAIIGVFAWAGFLFAIRAHFMGWTHATTFSLGGLMAMVLGVATMMGFGLAQSLWHGYGEWSVANFLSALQNTLQLLVLGLLPGLAGGWTYWLVAVPKTKTRPV